MPKAKTTTEADLAGLTLLGRGATRPGKKLETFPNHHPGRRYLVTLSSDEFTCICPATGQPDFATITINYIPDRRVLESKSLKLYLWSYRNEGGFHEHVTNTILDDVVRALGPHWCEVVGAFKVRGGVSITVRAEYQRPDSREPNSTAQDAKPKTKGSRRATVGQARKKPHA